MEICLSLGSNIGDRLRNLRRARRRICAIPGVGVVASSAVYETEPVGVPREFRKRSFLNAVLLIECASSSKLASQLQAVEAIMGRPRSRVRNEPRTIDIDIIYAGRRCVRTRNLIVPHPRWSERRFVVRPLADVRSDLMVVGQRRTVAEILCSLRERPKVVLFKRKW
jgi:2-amino-4-hydroxy-6-hydroxymethyldihydropteridine diphosphokinase